MNFFKTTTTILAALLFLTTTLSYAADKKAYVETEFISNFSGKSKKAVSDRLGQPYKKEQSVKPSNAGAMIGQNVEDKSSKPVKVEMWYYKNLVKYDKTHTYKETEITFVNDRVMNIAFFNNR